MITRTRVNEHDCERAIRADGWTRMECCCGKRSRWSEHPWPVYKAQERHTREVVDDEIVRSKLVRLD